MVTDETKHINISCHHVHGFHEQGTISLSDVPSTRRPTNNCTQPLAVALYTKHQIMLGVTKFVHPVHCRS
jgi:hypothetical protein